MITRKPPQTDPTKQICYGCSRNYGTHWKLDSKGRKRAECSTCKKNRLLRAGPVKEVKKDPEKERLRYLYDYLDSVSA